MGQQVYGVATTRSGDIWVALYDKGEVRLYSGTSGQLVRTVACPKAWYVAMLPDEDGSIAVSCGGLNKVVLFDRDGTQRWSSTGDGFNYANGIVATDDGHLVVCDENNHRLQVLSAATGAYVRSIGGQGQLNRPFSIAFDPVARVLVVGETDNVSVWSIDGTRIHTWGSTGNQLGHFGSCTGVCIASDGTVFVADGNNHRVQVF